MKKLLLSGIPFFLLAFAGCTNSKVTSSWNAIDQNKMSFNKILVVGLFDDKNRNIRQEMEQQLAMDLKMEGYNVITSYDYYGPKSFQDMNEEQALKSVRDNNIDGVITIGLVDKSKQKTFVPGRRYNNPYRGMAYRPWGWAYRPYYTPGFSGHYENNISYTFETNLYDADKRKLIYSVQTESYDPSSISSMADDYSKSIMKNMKKKNVLGIANS